MRNPYTFAADRYAAITYEVDDLHLDAAGFAGLVFAGQLYIEPDSDVGCEEWYIYGATALNEDGKTISTYSEKVNPVIFAAIVKSVMVDKDLCDYISDEARL